MCYEVETAPGLPFLNDPISHALSGYLRCKDLSVQGLSPEADGPDFPSRAFTSLSRTFHPLTIRSPAQIEEINATKRGAIVASPVDIIPRFPRRMHGIAKQKPFPDTAFP